MSQAAALDYAKAGIRLNGIGPGWIDVPINGLYFRDKPVKFAGLYDIWRDANGKPRRTFAITTSRFVAPIHDRMAVILHCSDEARWLDPTLHEPAMLTPLLEHYPTTEMDAYAVSTRRNHPGCIGPMLLPSAS